MRPAKQRPIAYEDKEEIHFELAFAGKRYCDLIERIVKQSPSITAHPFTLPPETRLLLQVQGTEIAAAACSNLDIKVVYAVNNLLIDRFDIVLDTCHQLDTVNRERQILQCLFRQVNAAFRVKGPLGTMLCYGYEMWHGLRAKLMGNLTQKQRNLQHPNPAVRILLCMCHENNTKCREFEAAKLRMDSLGIERVSIETNSFLKVPRFPVSAPHAAHRILISEDH